MNTRTHTHEVSEVTHKMSETSVLRVRDELAHVDEIIHKSLHSSCLLQLPQEIGSSKTIPEVGELLIYPWFCGVGGLSPWSRLRAIGEGL
jgi:hypothetical protein